MDHVTRPDDEESRTDAAWLEIVAHYGERPGLDEPEPAPPPAPARPVDRDDEPEPLRAEDVDRFVPPPPPAVPRPPWPRATAWAGVLGGPVLVLLLLVVSVDLPGLLDFALLAWFVGGFLYLVATMPRTPRDPWDDGSRV